MINYESIQWWTDVVYRKLNIPAPEPLRDIVLRGSYEPEAYLAAMAEIHDLELWRLGTRPATKTYRQAYLFGLKAFKKWRLTVRKGLQEERREAAIGGFIERNTLTAEHCLPEDVAYLVKQVLEAWLPLPNQESTATITGRFGPGACEERLTRFQRFQSLAEWCAASSHWPEVPVGHGDMEHVAVRLCAVPKDWNKDRLITVEPAYSSFAQQYVRSMILASIHQGPLRGSMFDQAYVDAPSVQRRLAIKASREKKYATLDLKEASDRISWRDVQAVFPRWVVDLLAVSRSSGFRHNSLSGDIHMFAGMGNACTFVVETLFFAAVATAIKRQFSLKSAVTAFGDDLIVSESLARQVVECNLYSLTVNRSKSFFDDTGLRESCGVFAVDGDDITVPRITGYTDSVTGYQGVCDLHRSLIASPNPYFQALAHEVCAARPRGIKNWPIRLEGYPSMTDSTCPYDPLPPTRVNVNWQRAEAQVPVAEEDQKLVSLSSVHAPALLLASFTGQLCTKVRRGQHFAAFPTGRLKWRKRWLPYVAPQLAASYLGTQTGDSSSELGNGFLLEDPRGVNAPYIDSRHA